MKIKKKWLEILEKNSEKFSEWIDYIRVKINLDLDKKILNYFDTIIWTIDNDNSNIYIDNSFEFPITWNKIYLPTGPALIWTIVFRNISIPCFCYNEFHETNKRLFKSYWKFDFYWQFFRLREIQFISDDFYYFFFKIFWQSQVTRLDYRFDFFNYYENKLFSPDLIITEAKNTPWKDYKTWENVHSWLRWTKTSYQWLVRWYDKLKDINSKWKMGLYWDYFQFNTIYRLEFEFLHKWCYGFILDDLEQLKQKCINHINFKPLWCERYKTYDLLDLSNYSDRIKYIRTSNWYLKHLIENNINIFDLVEDLYIELEFSQKDIIELQKNLLIYKQKKWV